MTRPALNGYQLGKEIIDRQNGFVPIRYWIDQSRSERADPIQVDGWAFETPGWPEFHACVSFRPTFQWSTFNEWHIDHFETGRGVFSVIIEDRDQAPAALAKYLNELGKETVHARLRVLGAL